MDFVPYIAALASLHLNCTDPQMELVADNAQPWKGGYFRLEDGTNVVRIKKSAWETREGKKILMHELLHCGLTEARIKQGARILYLDPHEEMLVQVLTDEVMGMVR